MSKIMAEQLKAGVIFGDADNAEYIYLPGGEIGSSDPYCVFERAEMRQDLPLEDAVELAQRLHLKPSSHPVFGKRAY
ncbi:MAG: hypothetical protein RSE47_05375 [Acidaminococcaceae bacterium]